MADNTELNPGSGGDIAAADDIAGVKYQRVKFTLGADGVNDGDVSSANPMPIVAPTPIEVVLSGIDESAPLPITDAEAHSLLIRMLNVLNAPQGYDKSIQRQRASVILESGTLTALNTLTTLTNMAAIDGLQGRLLVNGANLSAWHDCVRARIT